MANNETLNVVESTEEVVENTTETAKEEELTFLSIEDIKNDLDAMLSELEKRALQRQKCYNAHSKPTQEMDDALSELESAYASKKMSDTFDALLENENPIKKAVLDRTYDVQKVVEEKKKVEGVDFITVSVKPKKIDINPYSVVEWAKAAHKDCATTWTHMSQKLNWLMCIKVGQSIGDPKWSDENLKNVSNSFMMEKIARSLTLAGELDENGKKHPDPTSNKQLCKTLNELLGAMIGEEMTSKSTDVCYMENAFSKKGKTMQIVTPKTKSFALILRDIAYRILNDTNYEFISKNVRKEK